MGDHARTKAMPYGCHDPMASGNPDRANLEDEQNGRPGRSTYQGGLNLERSWERCIPNGLTRSGRIVSIAGYGLSFGGIVGFAKKPLG